MLSDVRAMSIRGIYLCAQSRYSRNRRNGGLASGYYLRLHIRDIVKCTRDLNKIQVQNAIWPPSSSESLKTLQD